MSTLNSKDRRGLFLEMCGGSKGATVREVYQRSVELGDTATEEAYYDLARRFSHRGLVVPKQSEQGTRYKLGAATDTAWLEEDDLVSFVDPDYPLIALTVLKESIRQIKQILLWMLFSFHCLTLTFSYPSNNQSNFLGWDGVSVGLVRTRRLSKSNVFGWLVIFGGIG